MGTRATQKHHKNYYLRSYVLGQDGLISLCTAAPTHLLEFLMSNTSPAPLLALSMDDYESKLPLLEDMPLKHARRYIEPLKYQALVGAVLGTFERYPAIEAIQFTDDGTRDSNVNGYDIIAQGPGTEDIPTEHNGAWDAMTISDLDKLLWWFFDDEDFRADLSQARFTREEAVDQLYTMLDNEIKHWDTPWEDFVQQVYTHLGRPNALQEQAKALAQQVQAAIEAKGWAFVCEENNISPEEVGAVDGLLPLLMMRAWDQPPSGVCFRKDDASLLCLKVHIQAPLRAEDLFENVMAALTSLVNEAGTQPVGLDALYQNWLNEKKWQAWVQ